ncbi:unnamed protein product, partial [Prorocentrum cordatum]
ARGTCEGGRLPHARTEPKEAQEASRGPGPCSPPPRGRRRRQSARDMALRHEFRCEDLDEEHHDHMHSMLETWKQSYSRMAEDQKRLKDGIEALETENEEYRIANERLERQLAQRGALPR